MSYSVQTKEQSYEMSLTSTLVFNVVFTAIVFVIFPIGRRYAPGIFAPQQHLKHRNTGASGYWLWFIDVFQQPLSVYSTRGNLATIFAVFQVLLLTLYGFIAFVSLTILVPVYWYGTDQNWNTNYLTYWSKITLPHIEQGSIMILIPYIVVIVITGATMFFYHQFTLLYVFFRQRCLKRVTPQNFMVLLQNIPSVLDTAEEIKDVISPLMSGVKSIIPVPQQCNKLTRLSEDIDSLNLQLEKMRRYVGDVTVHYRYLNALIKSNQNLMRDAKPEEKPKILQKIAKYTKKLEKNKESAEKHLDGFNKLILTIRQKKIDVQKILYQDQIKADYVDYMTNYPPQMPDVILKSFDLFPERQQTQRNIHYDEGKYQNKVSNVTLDKLVTKQFLFREKQQDKPVIGSSVFLFCDSQSIASEKYTALIASDSQQPEALLAPNPNEIVWKNMAISNTQKFIRRVIFVIVLAGLFVGYIWGQTKLLGIINNSSNAWYRSIFAGVCPKTCIFGATQSGFCVVCDGFSSMLVTMVPTLFNCILMGFLPLFIRWSVRLLCYPSISKNIDLEYQILFIFLILIVGIIQVTLPDMIDVKSGKFSLAALKDLDIKSLIDNLGHNVASQQFTFINYIVNQYFTFPVFSLLNLYGITVWLIALGKKNSLDYNVDLRFITFNFNKQLAYTAHMFVVGFIFAIVAPITNVFVFITYFMFVTIDRYFILYVNTPTIMSDLSSQANMLVNVIGTISIGLIFMLIATGCYFFIQTGPLANLGAAICIICLILSIIFKQRVDKKYKRSLSELTRGRYKATDQLFINPVHINSKYVNEDEQFESRYNINDSEQKEKLITVLKKKPTYQYKMRLLDKLLRKTYIDLTHLPVSQVILDDNKIGEIRCCELNYTVKKEIKQEQNKNNSLENTSQFKIDKKQKLRQIAKVTQKQTTKYITEYPQLENLQLSKSEAKIVYEAKTQVDNAEVVTGQFTEQDINFMASYTHPAILQAKIK
ncbi:Transmembrane_domain-containing protein [Hexamita inflata]|uniref:Transmembrane domain-containing protein n=1 Tax=Hexamita inflata TaxID=28002 RepID=A0AA86Q2V2_9EUKA|nr:Transmembrane domain-containing protein [Hexamita inflata]